VTHISNALGTRNPLASIVRLAHERGVPVLVDGAQAVAHEKVDVAAMDCDFFAFSGHKMFGPTGVGCLYVRESILSEMPPWQGGGEMIKMVSFDRTVYNDLPHRFEAGTPNIAGAIGLGTTVDYLTGLDMNAVAAMEADLLDHGTRLLSEIPGVRLVGTAAEKAGVLSFVVEGVHPHDLGTILDHEGIAIRAGHHCAMPVMDFFGVPATARASLAFYNTREELDRLAGALQKAKEVFA
jgi:cysteine desulfurase/selenocysteine lyase